jgi:hypothetical protein
VTLRSSSSQILDVTVVDIDAALGDRSAAITFGVGVTPGPLPFSSSGNEILQTP